MRHFGRLSLVFSLLSWIALACAMVFGGLGPTVAQTGMLRALSFGAVISALLAALLAVVAIVRGPQRISAALGLLISGVFLLLFSGALFVLLR